jgi:hypothetical protein
MIEVEWEFEGDALGEAAAQAAVQKILSHYNRAIGKLTCPIHHRAPVLRVRGRTLEDLEIDIATCCDVLVNEANSRIRAAFKAAPIAEMTQSEVDNLRQAVERTHRCRAAFRRTEHVREVLAGKPMWVGDVAVFDLQGHPSASVCYAWSSVVEGSERPRYFVVLQEGPVRSSLDAVRASIEQGYR